MLAALAPGPNGAGGAETLAALFVALGRDGGLGAVAHFASGAAAESPSVGLETKKVIIATMLKVIEKIMD